MADMVRKHITVPREIALAFEALVGERNQSTEIAAMMEERVIRAKRADFFRDFAGFVTAEDHPEWATPEDVNEWVRKLRAEAWENPAVKALRDAPRQRD
ncbi:MAG: hypothetical protein ABI577_05050 [bacterium]